MVTEKCDMKTYMKELNLENSRLRFKIRSAMCPTIKMCFQSDVKFAEDLWSCWDSDCTEIDSMSHVRHCSAYSNLRHDLDLDLDQDLVTYFRKVIEGRQNTI